MRPVNIPIGLHIRAVWLESSLGAFWLTKNAKFLHAYNEAADHPRRLICVFFGRTRQKEIFPLCGSSVSVLMSLKWLLF